MKLLTFILLIVLANSLPLRASEPPNIIFILADDLGYGDLGCFGQKNFQTPHLDQLASEGMRLTNHYAGCTVCAPSRGCLHTGLHTGHSYQRFNGKIELRPDPQDITVARLLKSAGYHTALIGKSGLSGNTANGKLPNKKGFDHFFGYTSHAAAHRYYPEWLWRNGEKITYPTNHGKEGGEYSGDLFLAEALDYIEQHREGPFYLHLSLQQPHADLSVPQEWKQPFLGKFEEVPFKGDHYRSEQHPKATFAGMVTYLDHSVGQVIAKLKELDIDNNTLVIFSSDNGPMSEGGWHKNYFDSDGPLKGGKRDFYEGGIRVPTIAWWPGAIEAASESNHISAFWDFLPTACELADVATPPGLDGISYLPTLLGQPQPEHKYLYWEFYEQGGKQAVRWGNWKGIRLNVSADPNGPLEVYDLENDLAETTNVADANPDIANQLAKFMEEAHVDSGLISFKKKK
ncbi:arylsulfatase [Bythopirellula polymerisocia]|uniref:Arylsulfatase n=1 Tax=Bythopirellula polymerisocia TaxID=2528003 RepID=A0A5C6CXD0_9BACT|nr:arylsulfatase [Bythopirellula polymerisocia]TWU28121.1 Arylsulfatase [Bythopirellula polymerisocia]